MRTTAAVHNTLTWMHDQNSRKRSIQSCGMAVRSGFLFWLHYVWFVSLYLVNFFGPNLHPQCWPPFWPVSGLIYLLQYVFFLYMLCGVHLSIEGSDTQAQFLCLLASSLVFSVFRRKRLSTSDDNCRKSREMNTIGRHHTSIWVKIGQFVHFCFYTAQKVLSPHLKKFYDTIRFSA